MFRSMLLAVAAALALPAAADITAVYAMAGGEQLRVEYRDAANFRIGTDSRNHQLMLDGRLYAVAQGQVIDVDKMSRQIKAVGAETFLAGVLGNATADVPTDVSMRPLGRKETVAGQTGEVYEAVARTANGEQRADLVVTRNPDLTAVQNALLKVAKEAVAAVGAESSAYTRPLQQVEQQRLGGLLRYGKQLKLVSLDRAPIPDGRIAMP
ncbi:MAG: hypothetical protein IT471_10700 [Pseudomonadales bacterium]|jgi:hypothetical protein|nr:hypothetical protein [Pseudomonadales bacterium]